MMLMLATEGLLKQYTHLTTGGAYYFKTED